MISIEPIRKILGGVTAPDVDVNEVTTATEIEALGLDSLDRLELILACESEWDIAITRDESANVVTVGDLVTLIETKRSLNR